MKRLIWLLMLTLAACGPAGVVTSTVTPSPTGDERQMRLDLVLPTNEFHSFDEVNFQVVLANQGDTSILVHSRLHYVAIPVPAGISEILILVFDSGGNRIAQQYYPNYAPPSIDTLEELHPGDKITKNYYLRNSGFFSSSLFNRGEKYTIVAIYQNDLTAAKIIDGIEVHSWVGSIESNKVTFTLLP